MIDDNVQCIHMEKLHFYGVTVKTEGHMPSTYEFPALIIISNISMYVILFSGNFCVDNR